MSNEQGYIWMRIIAASFVCQSNYQINVFFKEKGQKLKFAFIRREP